MSADKGAIITSEERESIINEAVERALLKLPEVVGNLIASHVTLLKINRDFYNKFPEFKDKKDIVASIVEMVEGENPTLDVKSIFDRAVPLIRKRIEESGVLSLEPVNKLDRKIDDSLSLNGVL